MFLLILLYFFGDHDHHSSYGQGSGRIAGGVSCGLLDSVTEMKPLELTSRVAVDKSGLTEACLQLDFPQ